MITDEARSAHAGMPRHARNLTGRDYAVGDIHGCYTQLSAGLDRIGFDPDADRLFSVGDLVDRGPESRDVLHWLDQPWFHAICGNHDFMVWRAALGQEYGPVDFRVHGGEWLDELDGAEQRELGARLARLPMAAEVETAGGIVGLVHAQCPSDDWNEVRKLAMAGLDPESLAGECCLWSRDRYMQRRLDEVRHVRAVVHGHVTVPSAELLGNVHYIDSCGWRPGGHFTFLDLTTLLPLRGPTSPRGSRPR